MKKSDIILAPIAVIAIVGLAVYLVESNIFNTAPKEAIYAASGLFFVAVFGLISHLLIIGLILKLRVVSFKKLAIKYSLEHSFDDSIFFFPVKKLNYLKGSINGRQIEVFDEQFIPNSSVANSNAVFGSIHVARIPRKSINMGTKIIVDGVNKTPKYKQKYILFRNPFMNMSQIERYLENIK